MPRTALRNSIIVFSLLVALLLAAASYFSQKVADSPFPVSSFHARCGELAMTWLLTVASVISFAFFASSIPLFYQNYKRGRGHSMNGITASYGFERLFLSFAFAVPFLNLKFAPCWMPPGFYSLVLGAVAVVMLHTWRRTPELISIKDFEMTGLIHINHVIKKLDHNEPVTKAEIEVFMKWAEPRLQRLKAGLTDLETEGLP